MSEAADEIGAKVRRIVVNHLGGAEAKVTPEASFIDDLGADNLDTVELVVAPEEAFRRNSRRCLRGRLETAGSGVLKSGTSRESEASANSGAFMQRTGDGAEEVAAALHPDMTADDVTRYLAGEPAIDEDNRGFKVDALMSQFADSIEEVEQETFERSGVGGTLSFPFRTPP